MIVIATMSDRPGRLRAEAEAIHKLAEGELTWPQAFQIAFQALEFEPPPPVQQSNPICPAYPPAVVNQLCPLSSPGHRCTSTPPSKILTLSRPAESSGSTTLQNSKRQKKQSIDEVIREVRISLAADQDLTPDYYSPQRQDANTLIISAIAHALLHEQKSLNDDGNLPPYTNAVKLFLEGRDAAARTHTHTTTNKTTDEEWKTQTQALMKKINNQRGSTKTSFRDCLVVIEPGHPLIANTVPAARGVASTSSKPSASIYQHNSSSTTRPASLIARATKDVPRTTSERLPQHSRVYLWGLLSYIGDVKAREDDTNARKWVKIAIATTMGEPCDGGDGCRCGFEHDVQCVRVAVEKILHGTATRSFPSERVSNAAAAAMAKMGRESKLSVLEAGSRACWPVGAVTLQVDEVKVKTQEGPFKSIFSAKPCMYTSIAGI